MLSLPMWERGLKRAWFALRDAAAPVAPHVGAWIETFYRLDLAVEGLSLPMWERGLKLDVQALEDNAPISRSPCGSVD